MTIENTQQQEFDFSLVVPGFDIENQDHTDALFERGGEDCIPQKGVGYATLNFSLSDTTLAAAVARAVQCVGNAGFKPTAIEPDDLVSQADIVERSGLTKASVNNYIQGIRGGNFPPPIRAVTGKHSLWSWSDIARWLASNGRANQQAVDRAVEFLKVAKDQFKQGH